MACTGTWGFVEWASVECVKALAKSQAQGSCPWTHLGGVAYWLILNTPNMPVPAYASSAAAAASMSVLTPDQKPKYIHATDGHQTDQSAVVQSGAVQVSGAVQSAALHPEGVATSYQYPSYGHGYGMPPLCVGHFLACIHCCHSKGGCETLPQLSRV